MLRTPRRAHVRRARTCARPVRTWGGAFWVSVRAVGRLFQARRSDSTVKLCPTQCAKGEGVLSRCASQSLPRRSPAEQGTILVLLARLGIHAVVPGHLERRRHSYLIAMLPLAPGSTDLRRPTRERRTHIGKRVRSVGVRMHTTRCQTKPEAGETQTSSWVAQATATTDGLAGCSAPHGAVAAAVAAAAAAALHAGLSSAFSPRARLDEAVLAQNRKSGAIIIVVAAVHVGMEICVSGLRLQQKQLIVSLRKEVDIGQYIYINV